MGCGIRTGMAEQTEKWVCQECGFIRFYVSAIQAWCFYHRYPRAMLKIEASTPASERLLPGEDLAHRPDLIKRLVEGEPGNVPTCTVCGRINPDEYCAAAMRGADPAITECARWECRDVAWRGGFCIAHQGTTATGPRDANTLTLEKVKRAISTLARQESEDAIRKPMTAMEFMSDYLDRVAKAEVKSDLTPIERFQGLPYDECAPEHLEELTSTMTDKQKQALYEHLYAKHGCRIWK